MGLRVGSRIKKSSLIVMASITILGLLNGCGQPHTLNEKESGQDLYSIRMAQSEMTRFPEPWMTEHAMYPEWNYKIGILTKSMVDLSEYTGNMKYFDYMEPYYDMMINEDGVISKYELTDFNIDQINPGKVLFDLYWLTGEKKYRMALDKAKLALIEVQDLDDHQVLTDVNLGLLTVG